MGAGGARRVVGLDGTCRGGGGGGDGRWGRVVQSMVALGDMNCLGFIRIIAAPIPWKHRRIE